jgi:hypothetical protein
MLIWVDDRLINSETCTVIEPAPRKGEERDKFSTWVARFVDGSAKHFRASDEEICDLATQLVPAPPGYFVLTRAEGKVFSEAVVAFGILPTVEFPPSPYTVRGKCELDPSTGLLCPDGQVVTDDTLFRDRLAFEQGIRE